MKSMTRKWFLAAAAAAPLAMAAPNAMAVPGWSVEIHDGVGIVDSVADALASIDGPADHTDNPAVINYQGQGAGGSIGGDSTFGGGFDSTDDFVLTATGYVTGIGGVGSASYQFGVNSDDGFRVQRNGVTIGEFDGVRAPGDTLFNATVTNGDKLELLFFERGGGEEVEFYTVGAGGTRSLVGANGIGIDTDPTDAPTEVVDLGWTVETYNASSAGAPFGDGDSFVENLAEAEELIALGGPDGMSMPVILDITTGNFPGQDANDFAVIASGFASVVDGVSEDVFLYVNSDDGFRLKINGVVVNEVDALTGNSNSVSGLVTINDGDFIELIMFERGGDEKVVLSVDADGSLGTTGDRSLLGTLESGIQITKQSIIPEPTTAILGLFGAGALLARRRRNA